MDDDLALFRSMQNDMKKLDLDSLAKEGERERQKYSTVYINRC